MGRDWLSHATFLDGIALAGILPAQLVTFATFVGYVSGGGLVGGLIVTADMFLPAFAFSLIFFERLEAVVEQPALQRVLEGGAAAVVGMIGTAFVQLALEAAGRVSSPIITAVLFCMALLGAWRLKGVWVTPAILADGAIAGSALSL